MKLVAQTPLGWGGTEGRQEDGLGQMDRAWMWAQVIVDRASWSCVDAVSLEGSLRAQAG